jgi:hypothetical protein
VPEGRRKGRKNQGGRTDSRGAKRKRTQGCPREMGERAEEKATFRLTTASLDLKIVVIGGSKIGPSQA